MGITDLLKKTGRVALIGAVSVIGIGGTCNGLEYGKIAFIYRDEGSDYCSSFKETVDSLKKEEGDLISFLNGTYGSRAGYERYLRKHCKDE